MTLTEAKQYESQGWSHTHIWTFSHHAATYGVYKCRCGKCMIKIPGSEIILP